MHTPENHRKGQNLHSNQECHPVNNYTIAATLILFSIFVLFRDIRWGLWQMVASVANMVDCSLFYLSTLCKIFKRNDEKRRDQSPAQLGGASGSVFSGSVTTVRRWILSLDCAVLHSSSLNRFKAD